MLRLPTQEELEEAARQGFDLSTYDGQPLNFPDPPPTSAFAAGGRAAAASAIPSLAAGAGFAGGMKLGGMIGAPGGPIGIGAGMLIGAGLGYGAARLAAAGQEAVLPDSVQQQLAIDQAQHPVATMVGGLSTLPLGGMNPSIAGTKALAGVAGKLGGVVAPLSFVEKQVALNAGIGASLGGIQTAVEQKLQGRELDAGEIARNAAIGATFIKPNAIGRAYGFHPIPERIIDSETKLRAQLQPLKGQVVEPVREPVVKIPVQGPVKPEFIDARNKPEVLPSGLTAEEQAALQDIPLNQNKGTRTPLAQEVEAGIAELGAEMKAGKEYRETLEKEIAARAGIRQINDDPNSPSMGVAELGNPEPTTRLRTDAEIDTPAHEVTHFTIERLRQAAARGDKTAIRQMSQLENLSKPGWEYYNKIREAAGEKPWTLDEFIVSEQGNEFVRRQLNLPNETGWQKWWGDTKALAKSKWGTPTIEQARRAENFRLVNNPRTGKINPALLAENQVESAQNKNDAEEYKQLMLSLKGKSLDEAQDTLQKIEDIKNRNGGMPPVEKLPLNPEWRQDQREDIDGLYRGRGQDKDKPSPEELNYSWDAWEARARVLGEAVLKAYPTAGDKWKAMRRDPVEGIGKSMLEALAQNDPGFEKLWLNLQERGLIKVAGSNDWLKESIAHMNNIRENNNQPRFIRKFQNKNPDDTIQAISELRTLFRNKGYKVPEGEQIDADFARLISGLGDEETMQGLREHVGEIEADNFNRKWRGLSAIESRGQDKDKSLASLQDLILGRGHKYSADKIPFLPEKGYVFPIKQGIDLDTLREIAKQHNIIIDRIMGKDIDRLYAYTKDTEDPIKISDLPLEISDVLLDMMNQHHNAALEPIKNSSRSQNKNPKQDPEITILNAARSTPAYREWKVEQQRQGLPFDNDAFREALATDELLQDEIWSEPSVLEAQAQIDKLAKAPAPTPEAEAGNVVEKPVNVPVVPPAEMQPAKSVKELQRESTGPARRSALKAEDDRRAAQLQREARQEAERLANEKPMTVEEVRARNKAMLREMGIESSDEVSAAKGVEKVIAKTAEEKVQGPKPWSEMKPQWAKDVEAGDAARVRDDKRRAIEESNRYIEERKRQGRFQDKNPEIKLTTMAEKLLKSPTSKLPFNKSDAANGEQLLSSIKNLVTPGEWDMLQIAGIEGAWKGKIVNRERAIQWIKDNGPKVKVETYGMEGKVSEAKREYDDIAHNWYDEQPALLRQLLDKTLNPEHNSKVTETAVREYYTHYPDTTEQVIDSQVEKAVRYKELNNKIRNEPRDTSPRATSAYDTVSAFPTKEPMPEWTTSAKKANGDIELNVGYLDKYTKQIEDSLTNVRIASKDIETYLELFDTAEAEHNRSQMLNSRLESTLWAWADAGSRDPKLEHIAEQYADMGTPHQTTAKYYRLLSKYVPDFRQIMAEVKALKYKWMVSEGRKMTQEQRDAAGYPTATKNLAPKNVQRVDVVIPEKTPPTYPEWLKETGLNDSQVTQDAYNRELAKDQYKRKWQPDNLHENLPNTLGWAMIQYKTGPKGEKIAVIAEAQSGWGQSRRSALESHKKTTIGQDEQGWFVQNADGAKFRRSSKEAAEQFIKKSIDNLAPDHPLLRDYNRLILKAAIEQARKEGATHIVVSDAETAMMTEGHDNIRYGARVSRAQNSPTGSDLGGWADNESKVGDWGYEREPGWYRTYPSKDMAEIAAQEAGNKPVVQITEAMMKGAPEQKPGMRLNYDTILPKIAEELTGSKGERVSLGEHKNAMEQRHLIADSVPAGEELNHYKKEAETTGKKYTYEPYTYSSGKTVYRVYQETQPRTNLIFRNADGTPKTDVSGRMYPLENVSKRLESGDNFTLFNRYQDKDPSRQGFTKLTTAAVDKVRPIDTHVADAMKNFFSRQDQYNAHAQTAEKDISDISQADRVKAFNIMREAFRSGDKTPISATGDVGKAINVLRKYFYDQIGKIRRELGYRINDRKAGLTPNYIADVLNERAKAAFTDDPTGPVATQMKQVWIDHIMREMKGKGKREDIAGDIHDYIAALGGKKTNYLSAKFGAIRRAEGYGIPEGLRENDPLKILQAYGPRASRDLAMYQELESKPEIAKKLLLENPNTGKLWEGTNKETAINANPKVQDAMNLITGDIDRPNPKVNAAIRFINNNILGPATGLRDMASIPVNASPYITSFADLHAFVKGIGNLRSEARNALETGATKPSVDKAQFNIDTDSPDMMSRYLNNAATWVRKWQGREYIETQNRNITFSIGKELAKSWIIGAKAGSKRAKLMLEKFDTLIEGDITKMNGPELEAALNQMAKNFTDRNQGTYGARGLPKEALSGGLAPFLSLQKWSIEKSNVIYQDVVKPFMSGENRLPALTYLFGTVMTGAGIQALNELLSNKKSPDPTWQEALESKSPAAYASELATLMQLASFGGIIGDTAKWTADALKGKTPRNPLSFPLYSSTVDSGTKLFQLQQAIQQGENPWEVTTQFLIDILSHNNQAARLVMNRTLNEDNVERTEKFRDMRVFNELEGKPASSIPNTNPYTGYQTRKFKRTSDVSEAARMLPDLTRTAVSNAQGDPEKLASILRGLKGNSYQTFPSPERTPLAFRRYYEFLVETQGKKAADERLRNYIEQSGVNRVKSSLVPSF